MQRHSMITLSSRILKSNFEHKNYSPFFSGGPHIIWGLTGYIVNRFVMDIIDRYDVIFDDDRI